MSDSVQIYDMIAYEHDYLRPNQTVIVEFDKKHNSYVLNFCLGKFLKKTISFWPSGIRLPSPSVSESFINFSDELKCLTAFSYLLVILLVILKEIKLKWLILINVSVTPFFILYAKWVQGTFQGFHWFYNEIKAGNQRLNLTNFNKEHGYITFLNGLVY